MSQQGNGVGERINKLTLELERLREEKRINDLAQHMRKFGREAVQQQKLPQAMEFLRAYDSSLNREGIDAVVNLVRDVEVRLTQALTGVKEQEPSIDYDTTYSRCIAAAVPSQIWGALKDEMGDFDIKAKAERMHNVSLYNTQEDNAWRRTLRSVVHNRLRDTFVGAGRTVAQRRTIEGALMTMDTRVSFGVCVVKVMEMTLRAAMCVPPVEVNVPDIEEAYNPEKHELVDDKVPVPVVSRTASLGVICTTDGKVFKRARVAVELSGYDVDAGMGDE
jgi:hypothetical protein